MIWESATGREGPVVSYVIAPACVMFVRLAGARSVSPGTTRCGIGKVRSVRSYRILDSGLFKT